MAKFKINTVLDNPDHSGLVSFSEGDVVPPWAFEHLGDHAFEGDRPGDSDDDDDYADWKKDDLVEEIERRNADRDDDDKLAVSGTKAELAARLTEDDEAE